MRIGMGYDVHKLVDDKPMIIGGVSIQYNKGLLGHSDADVLVHAIIDSLLGAAGLGDIGKHFPDTDDRYKGISSIKLLEYVKQMIDDVNMVIGNIDATIVAQAPKMSPHINIMKSNISAALGIDISQINIKATTEEGMGFTGEGKGISAQSISLLETVGNYDYLVIDSSQADPSVSKPACGGCSSCPVMRDFER